MAVVEHNFTPYCSIPMKQSIMPRYPLNGNINPISRPRALITAFHTFATVSFKVFIIFAFLTGFGSVV